MHLLLMQLFLRIGKFVQSTSFRICFHFLFITKIFGTFTRCSLSLFFEQEILAAWKVLSPHEKTGLCRTIQCSEFFFCESHVPLHSSLMDNELLWKMSSRLNDARSGATTRHHDTGDSLRSRGRKYLRSLCSMAALGRENRDTCGV